MPTRRWPSCPARRVRRLQCVPLWPPPPSLRLKWARPDRSRRPSMKVELLLPHPASFGDAARAIEPPDTAISPTVPKTVRIRSSRSPSDACASTPITAFNGDLARYDYCGTNHQRRAPPPADARVLVIGAGGGRRTRPGRPGLRAALRSRPSRSTPTSSHRERPIRRVSPGTSTPADVTFVCDEARSWVSRQTDLVRPSSRFR